MEDARDILGGEEPFSYRRLKDGSALVSYRGKPVASLPPRDAERLEALAARAPGYEVQLFLAKATGNFKRGNERRGR